MREYCEWVRWDSLTKEIPGPLIERVVFYAYVMIV